MDRMLLALLDAHITAHVSRLRAKGSPAFAILDRQVGVLERALEDAEPNVAAGYAALYGAAIAKIRALEDTVEALRKNMQHDTGEVIRLTGFIGELEDLLPDRLGVCAGCKEGGLSPNDYVKDRADLVGWWGDLEGHACRGCVEAATESESAESEVPA